MEKEKTDLLEYISCLESLNQSYSAKERDNNSSHRKNLSLIEEEDEDTEES
jgi:hypothetical protein